jgi:hypothetical protein
MQLKQHHKTKTVLTDWFRHEKSNTTAHNISLYTRVFFQPFSTSNTTAHNISLYTIVFFSTFFNSEHTEQGAKNVMAHHQFLRRDFIIKKREIRWCLEVQKIKF